MAHAVRSKKAIRDLESRAGEAADLMKLLANDQRLIILCRLSDAEMSVSELGEHVSLAQSALSQHLAKLRAHGLVATRREGQNIYYRLASPTAQKLVGALCELYGGK
ncbi:MAG: metalloregulator ArsR/SmtB family transcription factor [Hyphomonadaceae bacterium JAD_PAG50586_4]|nr:MAG: metalloregulator ArsR/SmtB family transcription factor [Hyphomonadaceae bacterium JAD_PAG50586_4]